MNYNILQKIKRHKNLEVKYNLQLQIHNLEKMFINLQIFHMVIE